MAAHRKLDRRPRLSLRERTSLTRAVDVIGQIFNHKIMDNRRPAVFRELRSRKQPGPVSDWLRIPSRDSQGLIASAFYGASFRTLEARCHAQ